MFSEEANKHLAVPHHNKDLVENVMMTAVKPLWYLSCEEPLEVPPLTSPAADRTLRSVPGQTAERRVSIRSHTSRCFLRGRSLRIGHRCYCKNIECCSEALESLISVCVYMSVYGYCCQDALSVPILNWSSAQKCFVYHLVKVRTQVDEIKF